MKEAQGSQGKEDGFMLWRKLKDPKEKEMDSCREGTTRISRQKRRTRVVKEAQEFLGKEEGLVVWMKLKDCFSTWKPFQGLGSRTGEKIVIFMQKYSAIAERSRLQRESAGDQDNATCEMITHKKQKQGLVMYGKVNAKTRRNWWRFDTCRRAEMCRSLAKWCTQSA